MSSKALYIMIGGFLGSGKSTSILQLARYLSDKGQRVGLITNDQGENLVDTAVLKSHGYSVSEIAGGCFCCRFNSLAEASEKLTRETRPDVFIAEPVGSCTDLVATVSYPLRRIYGESFVIAPLSVIVDPLRAQRIFGLETGKTFSDKVIYVYRKQLEEADIIIINKSDLLSNERLDGLKEVLANEYPAAHIYVCSARHGQGLQPWFDTILSSELNGRQTMEVNYTTYGEGEALLGWLNATVQLSATILWDGNQTLLAMTESIRQDLQENGAEIAHLKMTLSPDENLYGELAVANLVSNDRDPELSQSLPDELQNGQVIVNLRAQADPDVLRKAVMRVFEGFKSRDGLPTANIDHLEYFKPSQPQPVYRDTVTG